MNDPSNARQFHVVYVCHANICRSPIAQRLLEWSLVDRWGAEVRDRWRVSSGGVRSVTGGEMDSKARRVLEELGVPDGPFTPKRLSPELVASADLVLTAERMQRATVAALVPPAVHRIFTMRQFARLAQSVPDPALSWRHPWELVEAVVHIRGELQPGAPEDDDIADPFGRPLREFRVCATTIKESVDAMLSPFVLSPTAITTG